MGCQVGLFLSVYTCYLLLQRDERAHLIRDAFSSLLTLIFIDMQVSSDLKRRGLKHTNGTCRSLIRTINNGPTFKSFE